MIMSENNKVSVIVPVYNEEKYLDECLKTLLNQSYKNIEIIVIDDGSIDQSKHIAKKYSVKYIHQEHQGAAEAKNLGAQHATGDILLFADSDFYYDKEYVSDLVILLLKRTAKGTYSKEIYIANPKNIWSKCYSINANLTSERMVSADYPNKSTGYRTIFKDDFIKVGGFDDIGYGEDMVFYEKLGTMAQAVTGARAYHYNSDSFMETFKTAKWVGKGNRYNIFLTILRLIKYSLFFSLLIGIYKSAANKKPFFLIYKIIWDFGVFLGIIINLFTKKHAK